MQEIFMPDYSIDKPFSSPNELKEKLPINKQQSEDIRQFRQQISRIIEGKDHRLLMIVGPCSIHNIIAAKDYATKLRQLIDYVSDSFFIVMRVFFEKPRTKSGWKGLLYDPFLDGSNDMETGLRWCREFLLELVQMGIPAATEFLDPSTANYFGDLISWACIGARTAESQIHRQMASGLPMPVGFKNSTSGNVGVAVNGVLSAIENHTFFGIDDWGRVSIKSTRGNHNAHIVLRGGENKPNYDSSSIGVALKLLQNAQLPLRLVVDCSHDNSNRNYEKQIEVFQSVLDQVIHGNHFIRGIALESNIQEGNQALNVDPSKLKYGKSVTDPCLDWGTTERLLLWAHETMATFGVKSQEAHFKNLLTTPALT